MPTRRFLFTCALAALLQPLWPAAAATAMEIHLAHGRPQDAFTEPLGSLAAGFKSALESVAANGIKVNIFPDGQLGADFEAIRLVEQGVIQAALVPADTFARRVPSAAVMLAPFVLDGPDAAARVYDGAFGRSLADDIAANSGVVVLGYGDPGGFHILTNSLRPVESPEDLDGLRLATTATASPVLEALYESWGARTVRIAAADRYAALEGGAIDTHAGTIAHILANRYEQVQVFATLTNHIYVPVVVIFNKAAFEALDPAQRQALRTAAAAGIAASRKLAARQQNSDDGLAALARRLTVTALSADQRAAFQAASQTAAFTAIEATAGPNGRTLLEMFVAEATGKR